MSLRTDDTDLTDESVLLRRIWNTPIWVVEKDGLLRPSSAAFLDNITNEVSVSVADLTTPEEELRNLPDFGLMAHILP